MRSFFDIITKKNLFSVEIIFLQMLIKLGCLKSKLLKKTRVTLFSPPPVINISDLSMWLLLLRLKIFGFLTLG